MKLIDELKKKYPAPQKFDHTLSKMPRGTYCVLGAYGRHCRWRYVDVPGFPTEDYASSHSNFPRYVARHIISANDRGNFKRAWDLLGKAIEKYNEAA